MKEEFPVIYAGKCQFVAALHRAVQARQLRRQVQEQQQVLEQHAQTLERLVERRTHELLATNEAMDALVRDLLDCSLIKSHTFVLHPMRCNLVELCQQVLDAYTAGAGLTLTFECDVEPIEVEVDRERMNQVLIHLLSNARKYSSPGSPITITLHQVGEEAIVSVQDKGVGIAEEVLPHIFEPFYRIPGVEAQANTRPDAGLGLYLSRYIVEQHGGRIEVQSSPKEGSTFSVVLPCAVNPTAEKANGITPTEREPSLFPPPQWLVS